VPTNIQDTIERFKAETRRGQKENISYEFAIAFLNVLSGIHNDLRMIADRCDQKREKRKNE